MPVITALTQQFYSAGGIEAVTIENIGKDYTAANITVSGDGYLEADPVFLNTVSITNTGSGYDDGATITVAQPIDTSRDWSSEIDLYLGQKLRSGNNIYQVSRAGVASTVAPTHKSGNVVNGTGALQYLGSTAQAYPTFNGSGAITAVNLLGGVREVNLTSFGSGYTSNPTISFSYPKVYFNGHSTSVVTLLTDKITIGSHWYETGDAVVYSTNGGTAITGLVDNTTYYVIRSSSTEIQLRSEEHTSELQSH